MDSDNLCINVNTYKATTLFIYDISLRIAKKQITPIQHPQKINIHRNSYDQLMTFTNLEINSEIWYFQ